MPTTVTGFGMMIREEPPEASRKIALAIEGAMDEITDFQPWFQTMFTRLEANEQRQFRSEGGVSGRKWPPLSPKYRAQKEKAFPGKQILERSGKLKNALTKRNDPHSVRLTSETQMVFGSIGIPYADVHQNPKEDNPLPQRRPLDFSKGLKGQLSKDFRKFVRQAFEKQRRLAPIRYQDTDDTIWFDQDEF